MPWQVFVSTGTILMILVMLFCGRYYAIKVWKRILTALVFTLAGVISTEIMAFVEKGTWSGRSFFGAVLFSPIFMASYALIIREKPSDVLDICAPSEAIMLALMKVDCKINGCCYGYLIKIDEHGLEVRFPSQIVECIAALLIFVVLLCMIMTQRRKGTIYIWYMIIYGFVRFVLNWFRATRPFIGKLPAGNFWALITLIVGTISLLIVKHLKKARFDKQIT